MHRENQTKLTTSLTNPIVDGGVEKRYDISKKFFLKEQVYLKYNESVYGHIKWRFLFVINIESESMIQN